MVGLSLKKSDQAQLRVEAQRCCRLTDEAVRSQGAGSQPEELIKNIPSPKEQWKTPVEDWANLAK